MKSRSQKNAWSMTSFITKFKNKQTLKVRKLWINTYVLKLFFKHNSV